MTYQEFLQVKDNASAIIGAECEFTRFYPSCGKIAIERGFIRGIGEGVNGHSLIIGQRGRMLAVHHLAILNIL